MSKGDFGHCMLLIEEGAGEVSVDGTRVRTVGPGDVVGEVAILSSGRRTASVVATARCGRSRSSSETCGRSSAPPEAARRLRAAIQQHVGSD